MVEMVYRVTKSIIREAMRSVAIKIADCHTLYVLCLAYIFTG